MNNVDLIEKALVSLNTAKDRFLEPISPWVPMPRPKVFIILKTDGIRTRSLGRLLMAERQYGRIFLLEMRKVNRQCGVRGW